MKQLSRNWQVFCVILILTFSFQAVQAERYRLQDKSTQLMKFQQRLAVQGIKLSDLLGRVDQIEDWRYRLDQKQADLKQENEMMQKDKKRVEQNEMSSDELQHKWNMSGRSLRYDREVDEFKQDVVRYNQYLQAYNSLAKEMMPVIQKRTPEEVKILLASIGRLHKALEDALSRNDIKTAERLVEESGLSKEFGYDK